jgi:HEAT repeat protein
MTGGREPGLGLSEEARHAQALDLSPETPESRHLLLGLLGDPSWRVRKAALESFGRFRDQRDLVPALIRALADPDNAGLRSSAAEALSHMGELAVAGLVEALGTLDADQRKFVVEVLGEIGSGTAREALVRALDDSDDNVRSSVADALGRSGAGEVVPILVERLQARRGDMQLAAYALDALNRLQARLDVAVLRPLLAQPGLERLVHPLLGLSANPSAIEDLVLALCGASRGARSTAIKALAQLYGALEDDGKAALRQALLASPSASTRLQEALEGTEDEVAEAAVSLLSLVATPPQAAAMLMACSSRPFVRHAVAAALRCGPAVVDVLLSLIDKAELEARVLFLEIIGRQGDSRAVSVLLDFAAGPDQRSAEAALRALGALGGAESVEALVILIEHCEPELARQAAMSLAAIGSRAPEAVTGAVRKALRGGSVRPAWLHVLGHLARDEDVDVVISASHHRDPEVRRAAIDAFLSFKSRIDEEALVFALTDEHAKVRVAAARVLGSYRSERALDALIVATRDPDAWVVAEAVKALGNIGGARAGAALWAAVVSNSTPIAIAALEGLARLRTDGLLEALKAALGHGDSEVVCEAIQVTANLPLEEAKELLEFGLRHRSWHVRLAAAEMLVRRAAPVSEELLQACLEHEAEPLVREAVLRLLALARMRR